MKIANSNMSLELIFKLAERVGLTDFHNLNKRILVDRINNFSK